MNKKNSLIICIFFYCFFLWSADDFKRLNYQIILPAKPTKIQQFSSKELAIFLKKIYQKNITLNGNDSPITFYVGFSKNAALVGFGDIPNIKENFGVFRRGRNILFYGFDDKVEPLASHGKTGTLLSLYYFLKHYCDVNFFFPGDKGFSFVGDVPIQFNQKNDVPKPTFELRGFYQRTKDFSSKEKQLFAKRMLLNYPLWAKKKSYYFERWNKLYFKKYPKYFAEVNGKRVYHYFNQCNPCFTNEGAVNLFAGDIIKIFNENPNLKSVGTFSDNRYGPCLGPNCSKHEVRKLSFKKENYSDEYFYFLAKVAKIVKKVHPDRFLISNTKRGMYDTPPETVKLPNNYILDFLTSRSNPLAYDDILLQQRDLIGLWKKEGIQSYVKAYNRYPHFKNYPLITPHFIGKFIRMYKGHILGMQRSDSAKNVPFIFTALNNYIQGRLLFNSKENIDELMLKFCKFLFPGAEKEMLSFYNIMEKNWQSKTSFSLNPLYDIYTTKKLELPLKYLKNAAKKITQKNHMLDKMTVAFDDLLKISQTINSKKIQRRRKQLNMPIMIKSIKNKIKIDGDISQTEWEHASAFSFQPKVDFKLAEKQELQTSEVKFLYDKNFLYLALKANEKYMDDITVNIRKNGKGAIWSDDCFDMIFAPNIKKYPYFQIIVNSKGFYRVLEHLSASKRIGRLELVQTIKATQTQNSFRIELKIPLKFISKTRRFKQWKLNIFRNRVVKKLHQQQATGILLLGSSFHDIDTFRRIQWKE